MWSRIFQQTRLAGLSSRFLCTVEFEVGGGIFAVGASPFGDQRVGYISGGRFFGPRINGVVLPGGGNWSRARPSRLGRGGRYLRCPCGMADRR
ncbi:DUF3237 family protein [Sphingopyxis sp. PET50]|uniref:DUF3237 family protein n=1 Tax=Sphingopyxis sp. PET50 TaxID=2976533 RepID=UPI00391DD628